MKNKFNRRRVSLGLVTAMSLALSQQNFAQEDYTSKVPQYTFSETLAEQEKELADNPLLKRFTESRKKLMEEDPHRPYYHFTSPEYKLNDPNGLSYWGDVPAAVELGRVAAAPVNTLRQQTHRCQEISVCF